MGRAQRARARLARNLNAEIDPDLIKAYRGTVSLPFEPGEHRRIAVKIVRERGIESLKALEVAICPRFPSTKSALPDSARNTKSGALALFGSVLPEDFHPDSDIEVLVDFEPAHMPGLFGIARTERELSAIFGGRKVDLRTAEDLSRYSRRDVLREAEVQYAQG